MAFAPASFNGLPFYVVSHEPEAGHRVSTVEIPNGAHVNESFGPNARKFSIEAYCIGAAAYAMAEALASAAEKQHRGLLVLPGAMPSMVRLTKASWKFEKDRLGHAGLAIEAVAEPDDLISALSAGSLGVLAYAALALVPVALGAFAARAFAGLAQDAAPVRIAAVRAATAVAADIALLQRELRIAPDATLTGALNAAALDIEAAPAVFGLAAGAVAVALGDAADPLTFAGLMRDFPAPVVVGVSMTSAASAGRIAVLDAAALAMAQALRALALGESMARAEFVDRRQALDARASMLAAFDAALGGLTSAGIELAPVLRGASDALLAVMIRRTETLADIVTVSAPARLPALWWSHRLYGVADRAVELAGRAHAPYPAMMPIRFEALAS